MMRARICVVIVLLPFVWMGVARCFHFLHQFTHEPIQMNYSRLLQTQMNKYGEINKNIYNIQKTNTKEHCELTNNFG